MSNPVFLVAAEWLKKQGGNVILLSVGIVWIHNFFTSEVTRLRTSVNSLEEKIEVQTKELQHCNTERARLEARVEWLVSELSRSFPKLKIEE